MSTSNSSELLNYDEWSMPSLVFSSIQNLLKLSSRKHKQLRVECETILAKLTNQYNRPTDNSSAGDDDTAIASKDESLPTASPKSPSTEASISDADPYFLPFKLACETGQPKLMAVALDSIQKLISYGYLTGKLLADPEKYPVKKSEEIPSRKDSESSNSGPANSSSANSSSNPSPVANQGKSVEEKKNHDEEKAREEHKQEVRRKRRGRSDELTGRRVINVMLETFYECSLYRDASVQLQTLKAILTCITSVSCSVHDHSLLHAVTACYQINLQACDEINKSTAKATLTQIFNLVFQRMEHFAQQLKQLEASAASTTPVPVDEDVVSNNSANIDPTQSGSTSTTAASPSPPPIIISPESTSNESTSSSSSSTISEPPGKRGYCIVCHKAANYYCLQTKLPVCSMECKLLNLERQEPKLSITQTIKTKVSSKFTVLQNDAYYLLRALVKLSAKSLNPPVEQAAIDSKVLSLQLLLSVMQNAGPHFSKASLFISLVKHDLVQCLLRNSAASSIDPIFALASSIFVALVAHFKPHLHKVIGLLLDSIYLPYIASPNASFEHKLASLTVLKSLCAQPATIIELFLNYDCDIGSYNTFQKIATTLEKVVQGSYFSQDSYMTELEESRLRFLSLEALIETMKSLVEWTKHSDNYVDKKKDGQIAGADPDNSPRSSDAGASTSFSSQFHALRAQKQKLDTGVLKFNLKPKKGLQYLFEQGLLQNTPEAVAGFLHTQPGLDKIAIGDYMGEEGDFNKKVLYAFVEKMDFRGMAFDEAIRAFLSGFRLPGEAQKIDRMMEKFAEQFHKNNPGIFSCADTAYVLAYSVIMLNTDAHNPGVKHRMTKEEFFRNCRNIDNGKDIDPSFLSDIYDRITTNEIKMKDDAYRMETMQRPTPQDNPKKRITAFMKESQQMVKRTQNLIKSSLVPKDSRKSQLKEEELDQITYSGGRSTDPNVRRTEASKDEKDKDKLFYMATPSDFEAIGPMFEILWYPSLATFSVLLEENESERMIELCLTGYRLCIRISNALDMETSRLAFMTSLKKFTLLGTSKEMKRKNVSAINTLLSVVTTEGNYLKESWTEVLMCLSEMDRLHLIATGNPNEAFLYPANTNTNSNRRQSFQSPQSSASPTPGSFVSSNPLAIARKETDALNASKLLIDNAYIERVFTQSATLNSDAIIDFVVALKTVSEHELFTTTAAPRVFSLQKIVEITYYNMGRIRLVWTKIWSVLSPLFVQAGCHPNVTISLYAIDSLRQLAMKFLEKDELANYQFQRQFFRPFEEIMSSKAQSQEARDLIIHCMSRMILARRNNIKSGWRCVFVVLSVAAAQPHQSVLQSAFDLLSAVIEQHISIITENSEAIEECINCCLAFANQQLFQNVSIISIRFLVICAQRINELCRVEWNDISTTNTLTSTARRLSLSLSSSPPPDAGNHAEGNPISPNGGILLTSGSALVSSPLLLSSSSRSITPSTSSNSLSTLLKVLFLLLTGLSRLVNDSRTEVSKLALRTLFIIINENGHLFSAYMWRTIFHGVLFPIFDDIRHELESQPSTSTTTTATGSVMTPKKSANDADTGKGNSSNATSSVALITATKINNYFLRRQSHKSSNKPADGKPAETDDGDMSSTNSDNDADLEPDNVSETTSASVVLVHLFARYYSVTAFLLPDILDLIGHCIEQSNEELALEGVLALIVLFHNAAEQFSVSAWWKVLKFLQDILGTISPNPLIAPNLRQLLGITTSASNTSSPIVSERRTLFDNDAEVKSMNDSSSSSPPLSRHSSIPESSPKRTSHPTLDFSIPLMLLRCRLLYSFVQLICDISNRYLPDPRARETMRIQIQEPSQILPSTTTSLATSSSGVQSPNGITNNMNGQNENHEESDDCRVFGCLLPSQFSYLLDTAESISTFAHTFNSDVKLRKRLYAAGFVMNEQAGRLPQLFALEAIAQRDIWLAVYAYVIHWHQVQLEDPQLTSIERTNSDMTSERSSQNGTTTSTFVELTNNNLESSNPHVWINEYRQLMTDCTEKLRNANQRLVNDYVQKTAAGQFVSLEHMEEVVQTVIEVLGTAPPQYVASNLDSFYHIFLPLIEFGSPQIRAAMAHFLAGTPLQLIQLGAKYLLQNSR